MTEPVKPVEAKERLPVAAKVFLYVAAAVGIALGIGVISGCETLPKVLGGGAGPVPEPDVWDGLISAGITTAETFLGVKGGLVGLQALIGVLRGKPNRATTNIGTLVSPTTTWTDTALAASALILGTASPTAPKA